MNPSFRTLAIALTLLCVTAMKVEFAFAQDVVTGDLRSGSLTDPILSRGELRRILDRPPNQNPLRHDARPLGATFRAPQVAEPIHDPYVQRTSWQEEVPTVEAIVPANQVPEKTVTETAPEVFGPQPSPEMQQRWQKMDLMVDFSVEKLIQEIEDRRSKLDASLGIDEQAKNSRLKHLEEAESAAQKAIQNVSTKDSLQNRITSFDEELERLRMRAKEALELPALEENIPADQMQLRLRNLQAELDHEKVNLRKIQDRIRQRDDRMSAIPSERLESRSEVSEVHEELLQKQAEGTSAVGELLSIRAREIAASTKVQLLDEEAHWHELSREKLPLEKAIHQRTIQGLEEQINSWNDLIAKRKQFELEKQILAARQNAFQTHPALKEFSLETSRIAQARVDLAEKTGDLQHEKLRVEKQEHDIDQQLQRLRKHEDALKEGGDAESNNALIEVHRNLIRPWESMARIRSLERELTHNRSIKLELREQLDKASDPNWFIHDHLGITEDVPVADTTLVAMAENALEDYRQQLVALIGEHEKVHSLLNDIKTRREETKKNIDATQKLVDMYAMWIQNAPPLSVDVLNESRKGAVAFFEPQQWQQLGQTVVTSVKERPWRPAIGLMGLFVTFVISQRFKG